MLPSGARLSTGVVSLESDLTVRTANQAASAILGVDLEAAVGKHFDESISDATLFTQFLAALKSHLGAEDLDWRSQVELLSDSGRRAGGRFWDQDRGLHGARSAQDSTTFR